MEFLDVTTLLHVLCVVYLTNYAFVAVIYSVYVTFAKCCLAKTMLNKIVRNATKALHALFNSIDKQC